MQKTELLLPVGNYQMCVAAIHNGADAIYVGMPTFNARGRSKDHTFEELKEMIELCHLYGVKVNVAFNILIFENELEKASKALVELLKLAPDVIIVQDIGLIRLIKSICPEQVVHASTQMTVTNADAMELLSDLDISRYVLGRENSLDEIAKIREVTDKEIEVFVHGALCVAYSGQCFTSESLGGRSANRGQCAQSCRFEYDLYVDGEKKELKDKRYLVSPQDLCGIEHIPRLKELGVNSFKVEGRLKGPDYVATVASHYRQAIDNYQGLNSKKAINEMATTYSRGFYDGWLQGVAHQELVRADFGSNRGLYLGELVKTSERFIWLRTKEELATGDGLGFFFEDKSFGARIFQVQNEGILQKISLGRDFNYSALHDDFKVYLNRKEELVARAQKSSSDQNKQKKIAISMKLSGRLDSVLKLEVSDGENQFQVEGEFTIQAPKNQGINLEVAKEHLGQLGHTVYKLSDFKFEVPEFFAPHKELRKLKSLAIEKLNSVRITKTRTIREIEFKSRPKQVSGSHTKLNILLRNKAQLDAFCDFYREQKTRLRSSLGYVILDYEYGKDYFPSIQMLKEVEARSAIATTRVLKPGEYHNFKLIERCRPDAILVRNLGAIHYFQKSDFVLLGDFSLNIANSWSYDYILSKGMESTCASYDMNIMQLKALMQEVDTSKLEITVHQYMPEFHMEHCVFAAFLSQGNSFRDCGKPCEKHEVYLKDMFGNTHQIKADQECRNTMFSGNVMSAASLVPDFMQLGVGSLRFEALHENAPELIAKLELYFSLIQGHLDQNALYSQLAGMENYGVGTGQLLNTKVYKDKKIKQQNL